MKNQRQEQLLQIIAEETVETQEQLLERLQERGIRSTQATISRDIKELHLIKEPVGQGRYRYAKALELGAHADAVLHCVPRYENTAVVLELSGLSEQCLAPLFELSLDGDWDESAWARLRSFLYYC